MLAGGYRLRDGSRITIAVMGALVPEAMEAADELGAEVVCITSADLLFRAFQARAGLADGPSWILEELFPEPRPIVSLVDGHPHTLGFLAAIHGVRMSCLGVHRFGQSGDLAELYEHHQIDAESVIGAALDLLELMHDVAVIGGGIVGLATARELALRGRSVIVLEREPELGRHQTSHNSGVIHAGIYYAPGSLKARLCVEGASALYEYCAGRGIHAERCGKLVVAVSDDELERLDELERRATANGVQDLARLGPDEIAAIEPAAAGRSALHSPNTGMVDFGAVAAAYADDVREHGGEIRVGVGVRALVEHEDHVEVVLDGRRRTARRGRRCRTIRRCVPATRSRARARGRTGSRSRRVRGRTPGSCRSGAPTYGWRRSAPISCAARSIRCPTRRCRSSASTCRARSTARC